jgi:hypothetical protein
MKPLMSKSGLTDRRPNELCELMEGYDDVCWGVVINGAVVSLVGSGTKAES